MISTNEKVQHVVCKSGIERIEHNENQPRNFKVSFSISMHRIKPVPITELCNFAVGLKLHLPKCKVGIDLSTILYVKRLIK